MTRSPLRALATLASAALLLTACSSTPPEDDETGGGGEVSGDLASTAGDLVSISEDFGEDPTFNWSDRAPSEDLQVEVLSEGDGEEVEPGNHVVADYAGYVLGEDAPFDSSFERGEPAVFPLEGVVAGWRDGIPGNTVGSRLLISIPPELGYGAEGNPAAGIGGQDTIVFVVDLIDTFGPDSLGDAGATPVDVPSEVPVTVDGELGEQFTVEVDDGAPEPTEPEAFALSQGSGETVEGGQQVVFAYALTTWDNEVNEASWMEERGPEAGPLALPVGQGSVADLLEGFKVGSRVLMTQIKDSDTPAMVVVADIIAAY